MSDDDRPDLALFTVDELFGELRKRFTAVFLMYDTDDKIPGQSDTNMMWNASNPHLLGMIEYARLRIRSAMLGVFEERDGDE